MEAQSVIRLEGVAKSYRLGRVQVPALVEVTLGVVFRFAGRSLICSI